MHRGDRDLWGGLLGSCVRRQARHAAQVELFFLPSYSPDLNPDELLNQDVKSDALGRQRAATRAEMIDDVCAYLRSTQRQPAIVKSYYRAESIRYPAR